MGTIQAPAILYHSSLFRNCLAPPIVPQPYRLCAPRQRTYIISEFPSAAVREPSYNTSMQIKYIIDYKGYGNFFILTNTRTGECIDITREQAEDYLPIAMGDNARFVYFSIKADVALRAEPQQEIKRALGYSLR